jgi:hypothetical protein
MKGLAINNWTEGFENYLVENKKEFLLGLITLIQLNYKNTSFFYPKPLTHD